MNTTGIYAHRETGSDVQDQFFLSFDIPNEELNEKVETPTERRTVVEYAEEKFYIMGRAEKFVKELPTEKERQQHHLPATRIGTIKYTDDGEMHNLIVNVPTETPTVEA